jgi:hypothetical protein
MLRLLEAGLEPIRASRHPVTSDLRLDANDPASIRSALRQGDVVLDAAGPFQTRSTALVEAATDVGFDVVDLSDSFDYAARVVALRDRINRSSVRVLTACSAVSAVSAALIHASGIAEPVRASVFLAPAARQTANPGTTQSLLASLGKPVRVRREGQLRTLVGWRSSRSLAWPGRRPLRGFLTESADALLLPEIWPSLREVDFWVDTQMPVMNILLRISAQVPVKTAVARRLAPLGSAAARMLGSRVGAFGVEVENREGAVVQRLVSGAAEIAVVPAVLAVEAVAAGRFPQTGLIRADRYVEPAELLRRLAW